MAFGLFPLEFAPRDSAARHEFTEFTEYESIDIDGLDHIVVGVNRIVLRITHADGAIDAIETSLRIDSGQELAYLRNGGVVPYVIRKSVGATRAAA